MDIAINKHLLNKIYQEKSWLSFSTYEPSSITS